MVAHTLPAVMPAMDTRVFHMSHHALPQFRFEWHPNAKRVYVLRKGEIPEIGEPLINEPITDNHTARLVVAMWTAGYLTHQRERAIVR